MEKDQLMMRDHNLMDLVAHGSERFPIQYFVDELYRYPNRMVPLHWHIDLEFYVACGGAVQVQIGSRILTLKEGDGIFINSNMLHSFQQLHASDRCTCPNIVFSRELLAPLHSDIYQKYVCCILMNTALPYIVFHKECVWHCEILMLLDHIFSLLQKYGCPPDFYGDLCKLPLQYSDRESDCWELEVQLYVNQLWQILYCHRYEIARISEEKTDHRLQIRMQKMLHCIHTYYGTLLTLAMIAAAADISKSEASRCFQHTVHTSPVAYLIEYRFLQAKQLLHSSEDTVQQIAERCGFSSVSYFNRLFHKKIGQTPLQYRISSRAMKR